MLNSTIYEYFYGLDIFIPKMLLLIIQWNLFCVRWSWDLNIQHCIAYLTLIQELGEYRGAGMLESDVSYYCNIGIIPIVDYNCFSLTLSSFPYMVISKISINNRNVNTYVSVERKLSKLQNYQGFKSKNSHNVQEFSRDNIFDVFG